MSPNSTSPQWHECKHILPKASEKVLVYRQPVVKLLGRPVIFISHCQHTTSGPIWDCDQSDWMFMPTALIRRVTHWMPLPAPPSTPEAP